MYKLFFIAKNNMKKQKGDMITFFILTFIAALLIFDCASAPEKGPQLPCQLGQSAGLFEPHQELVVHEVLVEE